jgi:hypothetical protein
VLLGNAHHNDPTGFTYGTLTHYGPPLAYDSATHQNHRDQAAARSTHAPQPRTRNPCRVSHAHGLASSAFAHHYSRNHSCFLFLRVLRCFTSPRSHQTPYFIQVPATPHDWSRVPPFGHPRINARLTTPRGLSRPPTSFIGSQCQGIHPVPFKTHTNQDKRTKPRHTPHAPRGVCNARNHYPTLNQPDHPNPTTTTQPPHPPHPKGSQQTRLDVARQGRPATQENPPPPAETQATPATQPTGARDHPGNHRGLWVFPQTPNSVVPACYQQPQEGSRYRRVVGAFHS